LPQEHLPAEARVFCIARSDLNVAANIPRHQQLVVSLDLFADKPYSLQCKLPEVLGEGHVVSCIFQANIEQDLAMALGQTLLDVLSKRGDILFGGVGKEGLEANMRLVVVGEAKFVQDAQLIVVVKDGGGLAWRSAQRLLFLYVVGKLAKGLSYSIRRCIGTGIL